MHTAADKGNTEIVAALLSANANIEARNEVRSYLCYNDICILICSNDMLILVMYLVTYVAHVTNKQYINESVLG